MKKTFLCFAMLVAAVSLKAQIYVDGKDISTEFTGNYLVINDRGAFGQKGYSIEVDYGKPDFRSREENYLTDSEGQVLNFRTIVGALNYFYENGWEYEDFLPFGGDTRGGEYLLRRK